jgi:acetoin utilization deacetylase AcuC-like enzyme
LTIVYSARYQFDIGPHVFPTRKYSLIYERLLAPHAPPDAEPDRSVETGLILPSQCVEPEPASWEELALVHTREYLDNMRLGTLSLDELSQLELPWSPEMVEGFRLMVGGTVQAALIACGLEVRSTKSEVRAPSSNTGSRPYFVPRTSYFPPVCHIGGGFHHAFPSHGEGFCAFNDVAVAARVLQARGLERLAIVDLDVHHGNGTAFTFESDPRVFTFSMHQQHNYPMWKPRGSLDIGLPDGAHDATYLRELERALPAVIDHAPQCVFYLAGADPFEDDQLGGLKLTKDGLRRRDRLVIDAVRSAGVPLVIVLAGGYARRLEDTVAIHVATIEEAVRG